ncbi:unnamed protein product, partial [Polarella glacialis]
MDAHRVVEWCKQTAPEKHDALMEIMFQGYFEGAKDITNHEVLLKMVEDVGGLDSQGCANLLKGSDLTPEVKRGAAQASSKGVSGVPHFILETSSGAAGKPVSFSGAQPPD